MWVACVRLFSVPVRLFGLSFVCLINWSYGFLRINKSGISTAYLGQNVVIKPNNPRCSRYAHAPLYCGSPFKPIQQCNFFKMTCLTCFCISFRWFSVAAWTARNSTHRHERSNDVRWIQADPRPVPWAVHQAGSQM